MSNKSPAIFEKKFSELVSRIKEIGLSFLEIEESLAWGKLYGRLLSQNFSYLYRDGDFEKALIKRYLSNNEIIRRETKPRELHVISEAYGAGGHTRLMERLVSFREEVSDVVVVRATGDARSLLKCSARVKILSSEQGFNLDELVEIVSSYETVFMHIHPDDLLSAVAIGISKEISSNFVVFVNHADHVFSFGFEHADVVAEVSHFGYGIDNEFRQTVSTYLGIPLNIKSIKKVPGFLASSKLKIFSAGSRLKYKPAAIAGSFQKILFKILTDIDTAEVTVVGPSIFQDWWWWNLKLRYPDRVKIIQSLPHAEYVNELNSANLYLDSFPMTGGTALPEARSKNIPVAGMASGSSGYTPLDVLKYKSIDDLVHDLIGMANGTSTSIENKNNDPDIIRSLLYWHAFESVADRLNSLVKREFTPMPSEGGSDVDFDFYRRDWISRGEVSFCLSDIKFLLRYRWKGLKIALAIVFGFGLKNFTSICLKILIKIIRRATILN